MCVVTVFPAQERLRWKWPQGQDGSTGVTGDTTTAVARGLLDFLDAHLLAHEPGGLAVTADSSARALMDQCPRGYSVEVHHPALGGASAAVMPCSLPSTVHGTEQGISHLIMYIV